MTTDPAYAWPPLTPAAYLEAALVFCADGSLLAVAQAHLVWRQLSGGGEVSRYADDNGPLYDDPASLRDVEDVKLPDDEACCADVWVAAANLCGCRGRGA